MERDKDQVINTLQFCEDIMQKSIAVETKNVLQCLSFVNDFYESYKTKKEKIPYQLNIIDELRANENAHSRILVKLLQYKTERGFILLQSFIDYCKTKYKGDFVFCNDIKNPMITSENHRIDAFVIEKNKYAVIIENKVHSAVDQEGQIIRYIKIAREERKVKDDNIFVIYLSRDGGSPDENSFPTEEKKNFKNRYLEISYRNDIIPWLEEIVLPNIKIKEDILISALKQYIDHLQGMFNLRKIEKDMNEKLIKVLDEKLDLTNDYSENTKTIINKIEAIEKTKEYLNRILKLKGFQYWEKQLKEDFKIDEIKRDYYIDFKDANNKWPRVGIIVEAKNNIKFSLLIGTTDGKPFYGVGCHKATEKKEDNVRRFLNEILNSCNITLDKSDNRWYGRRDTSYENAYKRFENLASIVINKIKADSK